MFPFGSFSSSDDTFRKIHSTLLETAMVLVCVLETHVSVVYLNEYCASDSLPACTRRPVQFKIPMADSFDPRSASRGSFQIDSWDGTESIQLFD
jgi:hypothetical protein